MAAPQQQHLTAATADETAAETTHVLPTKLDSTLNHGDSNTNNTNNITSHHHHRSSSSADNTHGTPQLVQDAAPHPKQRKRDRWFAYFRTRYFWYALVVGQVLALAITSTNTFSSLLAAKGTSIPAFQTFFNYVLLNAVYTPYTIYRYGWRGWARLVWRDGWRYFILAFLDVEGNYFVVLGYRYATILSLQLINFFAIVVVVVCSLVFLKVRYHIAQYLGILICIGGMGILLASDHITGADSGEASNQLKGDLFALLGAFLYGLTNTFEEFLVTERPIYEVLGQLAFWGMPINGVQAAIFDRASFRSATWDAAVGGYFTGYTIVLFIFYSLAPILFRIASAAFFNISLLTGNFWGVIIGIRVFHETVHWMYPIAFVLILAGLFVYFLSESVLGEAKKPWLGEDQAGGIDGVGTGKRQMERPDAIV